MLIDFFTGKDVTDNYSCDTCTYNCGNKIENREVLDNVIWCDKYISFRHKMTCSCSFYIDKYGRKK